VKVETPGDGTILSKGSYKRLEMEGKEVYKFATREVPTVITEALEAADMSVDDVDWLLLHQVSCCNHLYPLQTLLLSNYHLITLNTE
jgi:3-oxoacyl-[acyl-carrier-protein] synthase III